MTDEHLPTDHDGEQIAAEHELFAFDDAAYVLGALEGEDLRAFTEHLNRCIRCQTQVAQLGGIPALLQRADSSAWEPPEDSAPPETLLPALLRDVAADRRRRRIRTSLTTLAAACLVAVLAIVGSNIWSNAHAPEHRALQSVSGRTLPVTADVTLTSVKSGTRLVLTCRYTGSDNRPAPAADVVYRMVVINRNGDRWGDFTWPITPYYEIDTVSPWSRSNISKVEIDDGEGNTLLQITL